MGQIKNIKLHIVTDIKGTQPTIKMRRFVVFVVAMVVLLTVYVRTTVGDCQGRDQSCDNKENLCCRGFECQRPEIWTIEPMSCQETNNQNQNEDVKSMMVDEIRAEKW